MRFSKVLEIISHKISAVKIAPIIFLFFIAIAIFSPYLFLGKMPSGEEDIGMYYPAMFFYQNAIRGGDSFLWNGSYYGGFPTFLNFFGGFFYPLHFFLFKFLPLFTAYHIAIAFAVFLGMLFSYFFGRANNFSRTGSLVLALSYTLSQTLGGLDTGLSYANGFMVLPMLLFVITKIGQTSSFKDMIPLFLLGVAGAAIGFLAGFPQTVLYGITFVFVYSLFLGYSQKNTPVFWRYRSGVALIAIIILGVIIASPQLLSSFEYLKFSVRTSGYTADVFHRPPFLSYIVSFFFPDSFSIPFLTSGIAGAYTGVLPFIFAATAVIFFRTKKVLFFFFSFIFICAMAVGLPGIAWLNNNLPIFSRISDVGRWFIIGAFPLSFLGAFGYEKLVRQNAGWFSQSSFRLFTKILGAFISLIFLLIAAANAAIFVILSNPELKTRILDLLLSGRALNFPYEHYRAVFDNALVSAGASLSIFNWEFLLPLLLFPASFFIINRFKGENIHIWFPPVVLLFMTANLFISFLPYFKELIPQALVLETPLVARVIKERETDFNNFRFIPFLTGEAVFREISSKKDLSPKERALINREILADQIGAFYGIQNMQGYEPIRTLRANQLMDTVLAPDTRSVFDPEAARKGGRIDQKVNNEVLYRATLEEKKQDFLKHLDLLSVMNVKYIISLYQLEDERLIEIKIPPQSFMPLPIYLYENKSALPRVYFSSDPIFWKGSEKELLIEMSKTDYSSGKTFIECADCEPREADTSKNDIMLKRHTNGSLRLKVNIEKGGWLIFSEADIPGWVAKIDSKMSKIYTANYLFQSIFVTPGEHLVEFEYIGPFKLWLEGLRASL